MVALRKRDTGTQTNTDTYTKARKLLKVKQPSLSSAEDPVMLQYVGFKLRGIAKSAYRDVFRKWIHRLKLI